MKLDLPDIAKAAKEIGLDAKTTQALIERLADEFEADAKEPKPRIKKQYVLLVSDPQGFLQDHDFAGWVLQIADEESPATTCERIHRAAYTFNLTKRGRLLPVQTIGEAVENVPAGIFKEEGVWAKTKTPVLVIRTNNEIPRVEKLASGAEE